MMKKAILVLTVVVVLALLAVPILAEGLAIEEESNQEMSPSPRPPGGDAREEKEKNLEMAPSRNPPSNERRAEEKNLQMAPMGWAGKPRA
jgi:hypothetical protein